jgi:endoglucanase
MEIIRQSITTRAGGVGWRGINRAGMEYGDDWDGWSGQTWFEIPTTAQTTNELSYFKTKGFNVIRLPISWERVQHELNGPLDTTYVAGMLSYIGAATEAGFYVVLDLHNYNRYATGTHDAGGAQLNSYTQHVMGDGVLAISHLVDVWVKLTNLVQSPNVILGLMNEPHDFPMTSTVWFAGIQQVIDAIRAAGSKQLILVPNSRGSDVDHWSTYAPNGGPLDSVAALAITDSANNYAFDMHAYQDDPPSAAAYANLVATVATWANNNGKKLFLSELGSKSGAANGAAAVGALLSKLDSDGVWLGWTAWDLPPYALTNDRFTADAPSMAWYDPSLT